MWMSIIYDNLIPGNTPPENLEEKIHFLVTKLIEEHAATSVPGALFVGFASQKEYDLLKAIINLPSEQYDKIIKYLNQGIELKQNPSGFDLSKFAGLIEPDQLKLMQSAIESDCEKVDLNDW